MAELQGNSALSGGVGAVSGELASKVIINTLYGGKDANELTEEEKQTISALSQLASGLAVAAGGGNIGDASAAINSSKNAVENNNLYLCQLDSCNNRSQFLLTGGTGAIIGAVIVGDVLSNVNPELSSSLQGADLSSLELPVKEWILYGRDGDLEKSNSKSDDYNTASSGGMVATGGANLQPDDDNDKKDKNNSSNKDDKKGVGGNGAASELPSLNGKSPEEARKLLEGQGFSSGKISPNGWQKFKAKDGSKVDINWNTGRVVRTAAPKYGQNGSTINKGQRLDSSGSEIPRNLSHELHPTETINFK
ncbi:VENN motif pre-toxin domain-containing protein [Gilliamella apicola]|uniref:VENN motif-containing domain-containing protein n=1 Tax=Gilliamella apicola TaxID=1196095 RepID=A0A2V4E0F5_9GAMM|nr:VENN motif pre-toxin domain-containing protein [Gilliamella apicola]PXZ06660.1 hypothetical protein DKK79_00630 [Gilliamella apicola]